jgi:hypothetical protein
MMPAGIWEVTILQRGDDAMFSKFSKLENRKLKKPNPQSVNSWKQTRDQQPCEAGYFWAFSQEHP